MPYVERDLQDNIIGVFNRPQPGRAEEFVLPNNAEIVSIELDAAKARKIVEVELFYNSICAVCSHLTFTWQADRLSVGAIIAKHRVLEVSSQSTVTWVDADNVERDLSWSDFVSLKDRLFSFHESAFSNKHAHRAAINLLIDSNAVNNHVINTGWPT